MAILTVDGPVSGIAAWLLCTRSRSVAFRPSGCSHRSRQTEDDHAMSRHWLTEAEILASRSPCGAWKREQLAEWGVPWPPPKGWKQALLDRDEEFFAAAHRRIGPQICTRRAPTGAQESRFEHPRRRKERPVPKNARAGFGGRKTARCRMASVPELLYVDHSWISLGWRDRRAEGAFC